MLCCVCGRKSILETEVYDLPARVFLKHKFKMRPGIVTLSSFSWVVWMQNICCVFNKKTPRSNSTRVVWKRPKIHYQQTVLPIFKVDPYKTIRFSHQLFVTLFCLLSDIYRSRQARHTRSICQTTYHDSLSGLYLTFE